MVMKIKSIILRDNQKELIEMPELASLQKILRERKRGEKGEKKKHE
jgi:hypothetical protein